MAQLKVLSKKFLDAIEYMAENPYANYKEVAEAVNIGYTNLLDHKNDPLFVEELNKRMDMVWKSSRRKAQAKMESLVDSPKEDIAYKAAAYILDSAGLSGSNKIEVSGLNDINIKITDND